MEEMKIEDEPELLAKVAHRGDVTDILVKLTILRFNIAFYNHIIC